MNESALSNAARIQSYALDAPPRLHDLLLMPFYRFLVLHPRLGFKIVRLGRWCRGYPVGKKHKTDFDRD